MIFRRKRHTEDEAALDQAMPLDEELDDDDLAETDQELAAEPDDESEDLPAELDEESDETLGEEVDWRHDGPFDIDEVDLGGDEVERFDLGAVVITPWPGMGLQLQVNEATQQVGAALAVWQDSGLQLTLLAAPTSGGLAAELREDLVAEAEQNGGTAAPAVGPFGPEVRRVIPMAGPSGEQLFQESRTWFAEGPRWLLVGTLLGAAAREGEDAAAQPFEEFFRNVVVRRGESPMVPGDLIAMTLPANPQE